MTILSFEAWAFQLEPHLWIAEARAELNNIGWVLVWTLISRMPWIHMLIETKLTSWRTRNRWGFWI